MSFTAYVAFESENGYEIHRSHNGGENYLLYPFLKEIITSNSELNRDNLPRSVTKEATKLVKSDPQAYIPEDTGHLINPDPIKTGIKKEFIPLATPTYETEVVYVINKKPSIDTFIPVNPDPMTLNMISNTVSLNLYKVKPNENPTHAVKDPTRHPDVGLTGDKFNSTVLYNLPEWAQQTLEQAHRYIAENCKTLSTTKEQIQLTLLNGVIIVQKQHEQIGQIENFDDAFPVTVDFDDNGHPSHPMSFSRNTVLGALPKVFGSRLRYKLYPHCDKALSDQEATQEEKQRSISNIRDKANKQLVKQFGSEVAEEYIPAAAREHLQKTKEKLQD